MNVTLALTGLVLMNATSTILAKDTMTVPLAGQWCFQLDRQDVGVTGRNYVLQASTNFTTWTPINTNLAVTNPFN